MSNVLLDYQPFLLVTAKNLSEFLSPYVEDIENQYNWKFKPKEVPSTIKFDFAALPTWYQRTVKLKDLLIDVLNACHSFETRFPFGEYFVVKWGGVSTNKGLKERLSRYDQVDDMSTIRTFKGISSWSKYLSLRNQEAAIYDSRVAYAINTINYLKGYTNNFFPMPDGRSPKLNLLDIETLFLISKLKSHNAFVTPEDIRHRQIARRIKKKYYLPEDIAYIAYLQLLHKVAEKLKLEKSEKFKIEMLLFALAPGAIFEELINKQGSQ